MSPYARRVYVMTLPAVTGFTLLSRLTQVAPPYTRFVFLGAGIRLGLPSHPASRRRSCLRLGVSTTSSSRGLSPPSDRPCRAYSRAAPLRAPRAAASARPLPWEARPARVGPGLPLTQQVRRPVPSSSPHDCPAPGSSSLAWLTSVSAGKVTALVPLRCPGRAGCRFRL